MNQPLFPAFLKLAGRRVLLVGAGPVAWGKYQALRDAGARVRVVAPSVCPAFDEARVRVTRRAFRPADLRGVWWVVSAAPPEVNRQVAAAAAKRRVFVNAVDDCSAGSAYLGGVVRKGGVTVAVSTDGAAPALAGLVREGLEALLPDDLGLWTERASALRAGWRAAGVPIQERRPLLLKAINALYERPRAPGRPAGFVSLVGAGPGDPGLLTARALERLASADLVLYDALVPPEVLALAPRAHRFFVGKRARRKSVKQETIHRLMIRAARRGKTVVRLKCGDPVVLGRGGEEALALAEAGIPFELVPGVTSAIAAPELAGIPVTHRGLASGFAVISGHAETAWGPLVSSLLPNALTLVVLMGVATRARLAEALLARGWRPATPVAVLYGASTPQHREWVGTLDALRLPAEPESEDAPGTVVVGEVVSLARALRQPEPAQVAEAGGLTHGRRADPKVLGRARLSFADVAEVDEFAATLERFEKGEITPEQWKAFRLVRGTYGQRQSGDLQMLRAKIPQGLLTAGQLEALARVGEEFSRGFGHITTRQNMQFHFVPLAQVEDAMRILAEAGLTTREACGNSVRNVTTCPYAGVAREEPFDVTPYAEALTRHLLRHPLSASLPRKFKIAFEGCAEDHALTAINDLGFTARVVDGRRGFRVSAGGGTATVCASGTALVEWLPAGELLEVAEAVVRVFHALGDRQHRQRNRMKFLIKELGWEGFVARFDEQRTALRGQGSPRLPFDPECAPEELAPPLSSVEPPGVGETAARVTATPLRGPGIPPDVRPVLAPDAATFARWALTNLRPQKQEGFVTLTVRLVLGDITAAQLLVLAQLANAYGDGTVRVTPAQNVVLRWVKRDQVQPLYRRLAAAGLGIGDADTVADVTSCPGAESCRLAVTQSRGLAQLLGQHLSARPDTVNAAADVNIKISGCPNGCGQHHIAGIGFQGSIRRLGQRLVPQYFVLVGGGSRGNGMSFGRLAAKIPARRLPEAVDRLLELCAEGRGANETATAFFQRVELSLVKSRLAPLEALSESDATPQDYVDLGEQAAFAPEIMEGECAS